HGLPILQVKKGHGSFLTFDFRRSLPAGSAASAEDWHLWIYCCNWRLIIGEHEAADSDATAEVIAAAATDMAGRCLLDVDHDPACGTSRFRFEGGALLSTWPCPTDTVERWESDQAQWMLYAPGDRVLTYAADGRSRWETSSQP
ncbi:MAG TPA: hypothetical protein VN229_07575, partial [Terriglobales bacterium]|nr:hypothetical protein [Terriglobales bacterium]